MGGFIEKKSVKEFQIFPKKRGQMTIFIIIAILIVAFGVLIYMLSPQIRTGIGLETKNPESFIQACLEEDIENTIDLLSSQGGSIDPEHYFLYQDDKIEYLCYINEEYKDCVMQQPLLKQHIESEIKEDIKNNVDDCFNELEQSYIDQGYIVNLIKGGTSVELLPKRIVTRMDYSLTITKGESETHDSFSVVLNNNLYELASITNSILNWETTFGSAETTAYMNYYHDLKVEKKTQIDGTTIYILTDRNNGNKFQFASRSEADLAGYGIDRIFT